MKRLYTLLLVCIAGANILSVYASEFRLDSNKTTVHKGEEFVVTVTLYAEDYINALEGVVIFPSSLFRLKEIKEGDSVIGLWIKSPQEDEPGSIHFSGIIPGGIRGVNNKVFSLVFEALASGTGKVSFGETRALLNDGEGGEAPLYFKHTAIQVGEWDSITFQNDGKDTIIPESFTPAIAEESSMFDGKKFLVFATKDKDSSIARYQIREYRYPDVNFLAPWRETKSPYVLRDQTLQSIVEVRAIDIQGNARTVTVPPTYPPSQIPQWTILGVLCSIAFYGAMRLWKKLQNYFV